MVRPNGSVCTPGPGTDLTAQKETAMNYFKQEPETLELLLAGLEAALARIPLMSKINQ